MAKVCFNSNIKYNGQKYLPNTPFTCKDEDLEELKSKGCWVIEETHNPVQLVKEETVETTEVQEQPSTKGKKKTTKGANKEA